MKELKGRFTSRPKVGLYARFSSDLQSNASIEDQFRQCRAFAERNGWEIVGEYHDRAVSGATLDRAGLSELLAAAKNRQFDILLCEALDRLSRDLEHTARLYNQLSFIEVAIVTLSEGKIDKMHVGFKGLMNSAYLDELGQKTRRGLEGRVRAGRSGGGNCYGYHVVISTSTQGDIDRGGRCINQAEAEIVRRIFMEYASGLSPKRIAAGLNRDGVPGPRGEDWGQSTINGNSARGTGILNNELYIGRRIWNRQRYIKDPSTGKRVARQNRPEDLVTDNVPDLRIIEQQLWDSVKGRQRTRIKTRGTSDQAHEFWEHQRPRHMLSGLIKCGACGGGYSKISKTQFGCSTARNKGTCDNRLNIRVDRLDAIILDGLRHHLMDPTLFKVFADEFVAETNRLLADQNGAREAAGLELERVNTQITRLAVAISDGADWRSLDAERKRLERRREELDAQLASSKPIGPRLHPKLPELYRRRVAELELALQSDETRLATFDLVRSLIQEVRLIPLDGVLTIELRGDLAVSDVLYPPFGFRRDWRFSELIGAPTHVDFRA
jgi:DNA invertase Pin-like site-specific DNA recombinase